MTGPQQQQQTQPQPTQQTAPPPPPQDQQQQLAPPPPIQQTPPPAQQQPSTEQKLDESKKEDSGRGLEFLYVNAQIGAVFDALGTFNNSLQMQQTNAGGAMLGAEAGVRFLFLTLGARFRYETLPSAFNIWQLDAVLGFHVSSGKMDIAVSGYGGYSAIGSVDPNNLGTIAPCTTCTTQDAANGFSTKGANVGIGFGADYYLLKFLSVGIEGNFEFIFLHRDPLPIPAACAADPTCTAAVQSNTLYSKSGDATGIGVIGSLHLALHI